MVEREVHIARVETLRAAVEAATACPGAETAELVRYRYGFQLRRAEKEASDGEDRKRASSHPSSTLRATAVETDGRDADVEAVNAATEAQRRRLVALRANGTIGDAAFQRVEEELDWAELDWAQLLRAGQRADGEA